MKQLIVLFSFLFQFSFSFGQNVDTTIYCVIGYKQLNFLRDQSQTSPITLFTYPNGNFIVKNGHVNRPQEEEITVQLFNNKGKKTKYYVERYENYNDSTISDVCNYFSEELYQTESDYFKSYVVRYSILLQYFSEKILYNSDDDEVFRVLFPCYNYMGDNNDKKYQHYNLIKIDFKDKSLVYKSGYFNKYSDFIIEYEGIYYPRKKEMEQIQKEYGELNFYEMNGLYDTENFELQRLMESVNGDKYGIYLRAESYESDNMDIYEVNVFIRFLKRVVRKNCFKQIKRCH